MFFKAICKCDDLLIGMISIISQPEIFKMFVQVFYFCFYGKAKSFKLCAFFW